MTETLARDCDNSIEECLLAARGFQIFLGLFLAFENSINVSQRDEVLPFNERDSTLNCANYFCSSTRTFALDLRTHKQSMTFPSTLLVLG